MFLYNYTKNNIKYIDKLINDINELSIGDCSIQYEAETSELNIYFNIELTTEQEILLTSFINDYISPETISLVNTRETITINNTNSTTSYNTIATNIYDYDLHNNKNEKLKRIQILSYINNGSYKLRAYDVLNNVLLAELIDLNNSVIGIQTLNITDNFTSDSIIEIQCLVSNNNTCIINGCYFLYEQTF